jgi:hypothetical protein
MTVTINRHNGMDPIDFKIKVLTLLHVNCKLYTNSCILNTCVTWQGIDYKLPDRVETCRVVIICEIIVRLLVTVQNLLRYF